MATTLQTLQTQFQKFHDNIKLDSEDNAILREKRDKLADEMRAWLDANWETLYPQKTKPTFEAQNQGSYAMGTGNNAIDGEDHDIDVGFHFNIGKDEYTAYEVKTWVYNALTKGARTVIWKYPCIRVQYHEKGELSHHVDITSYSIPEKNDGATYLAKAMNTNYPKPRDWFKTDPKKLKEEFDKVVTDTEDRKQFKRVIRGLKRWKDIHFTSGNGRPTGIAFTACAMKWFSVRKDWNFAEKKFEYNDLSAFLNLAKKMLSQFIWRYDDYGSRYHALEVSLPVPPENNLFEKMNPQQSEALWNQLSRLKDALTSASNESDPVKACEFLKNEFGEDFPIPEAAKVAAALAGGTVGLTFGNNYVKTPYNGGFFGGKTSIANSMDTTHACNVPKQLKILKDLEAMGAINKLSVGKSISNPAIILFRFGLNPGEIAFNGQSIHYDFSAYRVTIRYGEAEPGVYITHPKLARSTPHIWLVNKKDSQYPRLCLYKETSYIWSEESSLSDIVQWTYLWVYFYEQWKTDGIWYGPEASH